MLIFRSTGVNALGVWRFVLWRLVYKRDRGGGEELCFYLFVCRVRITYSCWFVRR